MHRERNIFPIALACSLGLHLAATEGYLGYRYVRALRTKVPAAKVDELVVRLDDIGDPSGSGIASNSSPGETPLQAREADEDQALLSRDPVGMGRIGDPPSKWTGPTGSGAGGAPALAESLSPPAPAAPAVELPAPKPPRDLASGPVAVAVKAIPQPDVKVAPVAVDAKLPVASPAAPPTPPVATAVQPAHSPSPPQARGDGPRPGLPNRSADPLPESDSDSDPFLRISGTAVYHDGKLDVRDGRVVKAVRPQLGIAGMVDLLKLNSPDVVCRIEIAPTGKVVSVKVVRSSRSIAIDEPVQTAMYDWTFQPAKDRRGKPIADTIYFTVEFR